MNCPLCIDQVLQPVYRAGIEIDVCPKCKGVWLDRGEIDKLAADPDTEPRSARNAPQPVAPAPAGSPSWDGIDDRWERSDDRRDRGGEERSRPKDDRKKGKKKKRKKSLAERLGDALEDVLDDALDF